ncbi:UDP-N-acetylenolpyruvoylglucosamine reductase [Anaerosporomusa subterranea]|uniref:UDP-N-acetylenolpyruvoylglucosamine reductase n=1 Tax=Anaerosporomusa subterranea TaxID=1794912 RepID=A0A154BUQ6_ANASB|nr:UDP-N-acetylenolpyruvoylglucosamine reductase [Anaerosporomusa subterranea]
MFLQKNEQTAFFEKLSIIISDPERVLRDEPMVNHTTFRIGGPADWLVLPASVEEITAVLAVAKAAAVPVTVLGRGSNVLVSDKGIRGLVLRLGKHMSRIRHEGTTLFAGAGASLGDVSRYAAKLSLTGLEFAIGIPGTIGGAVFMNAGAYEGEMRQVVSAVTAICPDGGLARYCGEALAFSYRHSVFSDNKCLICEVELQLTPGDETAIRAKMDECTFRRNSKQPVELPSAGSVFKRPPGYYAGTLIEQTGLKGLTVGGAQVSEKHAGFIVNIGGATASDVMNLIREVQSRVYEKFSVRLEPEVRQIGEP